MSNLMDTCSDTDNPRWPREFLDGVRADWGAVSDARLLSALDGLGEIHEKAKARALRGNRRITIDINEAGNAITMALAFVIAEMERRDQERGGSA